MIQVRYAVLGAALWSCQASPPERLEPIRRPPIEVIERFSFDEAPTPTLEPIHVLGSSEEADEEGVDAPSATIELDDILLAVDLHFPLILAATEEIEIAEGELTSAQGAFDTQLGTDGFFRTEGFRDTQRINLGISQPTTAWGAVFEGGYKLGLGDFDFYEEGAQTNEGGEFRGGVTLPLFQGREIDPRRVDLWQARIARDAADPTILAARIRTAFAATSAYWRWVSAGRRREIAQRLLGLAEQRTGQVELLVETGEVAQINEKENQRLVVDRRARLLQAERDLQEAAILLSLFWRDANGAPQVPPDALLPYDFPGAKAVEELLLEGDVDFAIEHRPELRKLILDLEVLGLDVDLARNALLPTLDVGVIGSQDIGAEVSDPDDKGPFELEFLFQFGIPLQLRKARGGERAVRAKLRQLQREAQFLRETIQSEVLDARSALNQNWLSIAQARENVQLANELAELERFSFSKGQSDLLRVNLREQQAAVAAASYVEVLRKYFASVAKYRAVLGVPSVHDQ
ncbi:MAG: TolC family protein [Planctomycetota bacterium]